MRILCDSQEPATEVAAAGSNEPVTHEDKRDAEFAASLEDLVLQNSSQFHRWHTELEAARTSETEQKYRRYAEMLHGHVQSCDHLLEKVWRMDFRTFNYC